MYQQGHTWEIQQLGEGDRKKKMSIRKQGKPKPGEVRDGGCPGGEVQLVLPIAAGQGPHLQVLIMQLIPSRAHIINCSLPSSPGSLITTHRSAFLSLPAKGKCSWGSLIPITPVLIGQEQVHLLVIILINFPSYRAQESLIASGYKPLQKGRAVLSDAVDVADPHSFLSLPWARCCSIHTTEQRGMFAIPIQVQHLRKTKHLLPSFPDLKSHQAYQQPQKHISVKYLHLSRKEIH